jgi:hypothetical protein
MACLGTRGVLESGGFPRTSSVLLRAQANAEERIAVIDRLRCVVMAVHHGVGLV